jgi:hypothetical protein
VRSLEQVAKAAFLASYPQPEWNPHSRLAPEEAIVWVSHQQCRSSVPEAHIVDVLTVPIVLKMNVVGTGRNILVRVVGIFAGRLWAIHITELMSIGSLRLRSLWCMLSQPLPQVTL